MRDSPAVPVGHQGVSIPAEMVETDVASTDPAHADGKSFHNEIADELRISGVTAKSRIGRVFGKLDLRRRAAAVVYAYDHGVVPPR
jgi:hypothetical protein